MWIKTARLADRGEVAGSEIIEVAGPGFIEDIDPTGAWLLIESKKIDPDLVVLDLRSPVRFAAAHVADAVNLNYVSPFSFEEALGTLDKNKTYLVYCDRGGLSAEAVTVMEEQGFARVYNMKEGFEGWRAVRCPVGLRSAA